MNPEELLAIFQRIAAGEQTAADVTTLRDVLIGTGNQRVIKIQKGNYNERIEGNYIDQSRSINQIINYNFNEQQTEIIHRFLEGLRETKPNPHNLPRSGVRQFVGRDAALKKLDKQLQESERIAISTLTGMGGIGKTELALQHALIDRDKEPEQRTYQAGICWVNVSDQGNVGVQILNFARDYLKIPILEEGELEDRVKLCWQNWREGNTLIIFDDVREYAQIQDYLPPQEKRFKVIITTRKQRLAESIKVFALEVLEEQAALDLIISFIGQERVNNQLESAKEICKDLGYLPLGLELVARFLNRRKNWSINKMRARLREEQLKAKPLTEASEEMTAERGVRAAFQVSWKEVEQTDKAQTVACYLSLFAVAPISWNFILRVCPIENEDELEEILEDSLVSLSLIKDLGEQWYEIHTLIQQYLREKLEESELATNAKQAYCQLMTAIAQKIPATPVQSDIQNFTSVIPHLAVATRELNQWIADDDLVLIYMGLQSFYKGQGLYQEAISWLEQCLSLAQDRLGQEHPSVAKILNNLAELYRSQGRYEEVEPLYKNALELYKKLLGEEHPSVAKILNNLAELYRSQGRYEEAEPLYKKTLVMKIKLLGQEHPSVATSLNNLALLYYLQGRYKEAEPLYQNALELYRKLLGQEHPSVAQTLNNLASLYYFQGQYKEAEPLYKKTLAMKIKLLGEEHSDVAQTLNNLALLYFSQGRYEESEPLYQNALELYRNLLGEEHPDVATSLNNLAELYRSQGRYKEAEPLHKKTLAMRIKLLGEEHPDVAQTLNNLALLYFSQGRYEEAESLYKKTLAMTRNLLGQDHPDVANSLNNLAELYHSQGQYEEAEPLYINALELYRKLLGQEHPSVAQTLNNLAALYYLQGRYEEAESLHKKTLAMRIKLLGQSHPDVAQSLNNLAALYYLQGRYEEAEPLYKNVLEMTRKMLEQSHPDVAQSLNNLALLYFSQGRYEEAEPLYLQALEILELVLGENHPNTLTVRENLSFLQSEMS